MEDLILLDTTELLRVMLRKLHAAWAELSGTKSRMPPAVADELAPAGVLQSRTTTLSVAEELLQPDAPALDDERRQQLERQAWWAAMWRDAESPYEKLELTAEQRELHTTLLANVPRECFPTANPLLLADNRDTQIVTRVEHQRHVRPRAPARGNFRTSCCHAAAPPALGHRACS